jgi:hypothetical protein
LLLTFICTYILKELIYEKIKEIISKFAFKYFKKDEIEHQNDEEDEILSEDIYYDLRLGWLDNYYVKANKDFEELINKKVTL